MTPAQIERKLISMRNQIDFLIGEIQKGKNPKQKKMSSFDQQVEEEMQRLLKRTA